MIGELLLFLAIVLVAGGVGLWLGIVILAPRLQRGLDHAIAAGSHDAEEPENAEEPDESAG